jgi:hypothetical protein
MALNRQMPLVAMARTPDGGGFGWTAWEYSNLVTPDPTLPGCNQQCRDNEAKSCGSGDGFGGVKVARLWAVYRMQGINATGERTFTEAAASKSTLAMGLCSEHSTCGSSQQQRTACMQLPDPCNKACGILNSRSLQVKLSHCWRLSCCRPATHTVPGLRDQ